jgi:hypothetical protein
MICLLQGTIRNGFGEASALSRTRRAFSPNIVISMPEMHLGVRPRRPEAYTAAMPLLGMAMPAFAVVATRYFARDIFASLALAILLSFALQPLTMLLRRWHFGRVTLVIAAVLLAPLLIFGVEYPSPPPKGHRSNIRARKPRAEWGVGS